MGGGAAHLRASPILGDVYPVTYSESLTVLALSGSGKKEKTTKIERVLVVADPVFEMTDERAKGLVAN